MCTKLKRLEEKQRKTGERRYVRDGGSGREIRRECV